jgi:ribosome biogenesis protein NSA1
LKRVFDLSLLAFCSFKKFVDLPVRGSVRRQVGSKLCADFYVAVFVRAIDFQTPLTFSSVETTTSNINGFTMRFITGDECGLIKECIPELAVKKDQPSTAKVVVNVVSPDATAPKDEEGIRLINTQARQSRRRGIVAMTWTQPDDDEQFACLRIDGTVELWQRSHSEEQSFGGYLLVTEMKKVFDDPKAVAGGDAPIHPSTHPLGLESFSSEGNDQVQLCACNAAGVVVILNPTRQESVVQRFCVYKQPVPIKGTGIDGALKQDEQPVALATTFALDVGGNRVAVGGPDRETVLFDIETAKQVWKTKNLAPDPQTLLQPQVWPTAIRFLSSDCVLGSNIMAVGNGYKQVRIYDVRASATQRRPICWTPEGLLEHRVTAITQIDVNHIVAGDAAGYLHTIDLRKLGRPIKTDASVQTVGRYVGPAGSVRGLVNHAEAPRLAAAGLDRMLRIYDTTKRKQVSCMYLRQRLNCVLVGRDEMWGDDDDEDGNDDDDDDNANYEEDLLDNEGADQDDVVGDLVNSDDEEEGDRNDVSGGDSNSDQDDADGPSDDNEAAESESEEEEEEESDDASEEKVPFNPPPKRRKR